MIILTGADRSHGASLLQFLASLRRHEPDQPVIAYDLGLSSEQRAASEAVAGVDVRTFDFSSYPEYFDIRVNAGEYAWKPAIVWDALESSTEVVVWLDAGCFITGSLSKLENSVLKNGFYSPWSQGTIPVWTHPAMLSYLGLDAEWGEGKINLNGAAVAFDPLNPQARALASDWASGALIGSCIAPPGSDRSNHRQDQALLTVLAWRCGLASKTDHGYLGFETHRDVEAAQSAGPSPAGRVRYRKNRANVRREKLKSGTRRAAKRALELGVRAASTVSRDAIPPHLVSPASIRPYIPNSAGGMDVRLALAEQAIAQTPELLAAVASHFGVSSPVMTTSAGFAELIGAGDADGLAAHFKRQGSDKSAMHGYQHFYAAILRDLGDVNTLLEVGLGTNNEDVISNMGVPGASLRAWRDHLPHAMLFGADIDRRILFTEERIRTFVADQTDAASVRALADELPDGLDLVIDDGLHSPNANLAILLLGLRKVRPGGWIVIEDIVAEAQPLWTAVAGLFPPDWRTYLVSTLPNTYVFCARRPDNAA